MTPTTYGRDFAYCLKSHGGVRGFYASLWRFLLRCTLFCHSVATFLTSVSSYEGGCGFEVLQNAFKNLSNASGFKLSIRTFPTVFCHCIHRSFPVLFFLREIPERDSSDNQMLYMEPDKDLFDN